MLLMSPAKVNDNSPGAELSGKLRANGGGREESSDNTEELSENAGLPEDLPDSAGVAITIKVNRTASSNFKALAVRTIKGYMDIGSASSEEAAIKTLDSWYKREWYLSAIEEAYKADENNLALKITREYDVFKEKDHDGSESVDEALPEPIREESIKSLEVNRASRLKAKTGTVARLKVLTEGDAIKALEEWYKVENFGVRIEEALRDDDMVLALKSQKRETLSCKRKASRRKGERQPANGCT